MKRAPIVARSSTYADRSCLHRIFEEASVYRAWQAEAAWSRASRSTSRPTFRRASRPFSRRRPRRASSGLATLDCREPDAALRAAAARLEAATNNAAGSSAQVLAAISAARAAESGVAAARAQRDALDASRLATERQRSRMQKLEREGTATEGQLDRATTEADQLREQVMSLESQMTAARDRASSARASADAARAGANAAIANIEVARADVARAQAIVDECKLATPIAGVVLFRALEPGEVVFPGSRVLVVVSLDIVETVFYLANAELAVAAPGRTVTVRADAYPNEVLAGTIASVASKAEFTPRNVQTREDRDRLVYAVRVRIPNPRALLRPGMPVDVVIDGTGEAKR